MKSVIILGGGASVIKGIESGLWDNIKNNEVWSLNYCFKAMPFLPTAQLWVDKSFFSHEKENIMQMHHLGIRLHCKHFPNYYNDYNFINTYVCCPSKKDIDKNQIYVGALGLSGTFAIQIAIELGYDKIYLLGYDYGTTDKSNKKTHWYQDLIPELNIKSSGAGNPMTYRDPNGAIKGVRDYEHLSIYKDRIINVGLDSNIQTFEKVSYEEFYKRNS